MSSVLARLPTGLRHAAIYAAALGLSKLTAIAMLPVFTHFLTPEEYGRLDVLQTLANLLSIVIGFGMADTLFRFAGAAETEQNRKEAAARVFGLALMASGLSLVVTQLAAPWVAGLLPGDPGLFNTRVILISLSVTGAILVPLSWLRMRGRAWGYFSGSAGRALAQAFVVALFLVLGFGVEGVLLGGMLCALALAIVLSVLQWRDTGVQFAFSSLRDQGRFGGTLVLAGMATFVLDSCDRWILAGTIGTEALADYALAGKIGIMAAFLTQPFEMWWLPKRFSVLASVNGHERCARMTELGACVAMVASIGIAGIGPMVITWMTPMAYHGAIAFVSALAGLAALNAATTLVNTGVLSDKRTVKPIWIDGIAAVVAIAAYLVLIPIFGAWGAIWATVMALTLRFGMYLVIGQSVCRFPYRLSALMALASLTLGCLVAIDASTDLATKFFVAMTGAAIVVLVALATRVIPMPERHQWRFA